MFLKISTALGIKDILGRNVDKKMSIKTSYKVMKILLALEDEEKYYKDQYKKIIDEYAILQADGNYALTADGQNIKLQEGKENELDEKIKELDEIEIEMPDFKLTIEEMESFGELNPREMYKLDSIIE